MSFPPCILNVAEKPSVAKEVSIILSQNRYSTIRSDSQYNPVYEFDFEFRSQPCKMNFTSVTGHIMNFSFPASYKDWKSIDPKTLLKDAPVTKTVMEEKLPLAANLKRLSTKASILVLWLDCDAEGEAIAFEVLEICKQSNRSLSVLRARFSAVTRQDINHAFQNLIEPNKNLADSIEARQEIDLRIGASFTRFQTLTLRPRFSSLASNLISYGPCQIPTLGFVVERYKKVKSFVPENFWFITCKYDSRSGNIREYVEFTWSRTRLFDEYSSRILFEQCLEAPMAEVMKVQTCPKSKWRPLPLNTIELQKLASRKLHISSSRLMEIAEKLYNKGFVSYPRTETDSFLKTINLKELIGYHEENNEWGDYAKNLLEEGGAERNGFLWPRIGTHNDNAHPPIHPVKNLQKHEVSLEEWKVYELISRHFLACCSHDAKGQEKQLEIAINQEKFFAKGLLITHFNYLSIYIYEKWSETNLPGLSMNQKFLPTELFLKEGKTTPPQLLSEADLIATMDRNGIGTDATIAEHIKTIQERGYAEKVQGSFFSPTSFGLALVESYEEMGLELAKPKLRAEMEKKMKDIVAGRRNKAEVVRESVERMEEVYLQISGNRNAFIDNIRRFYRDEGNSFVEEERKEEDVDLGCCRVCQRSLVLAITQWTRGLTCRECNVLMGLPKQGDLKKVMFNCPLCKSQIISVKTVNNTNYYLCPYCYNNPPSEFESSSVPDKSPSKFNQSMPCFKCPNQVCQYASGWLQKPIFPCEICGKNMLLKKTKKGNFFLGCSNYPTCKNSAFLPECINECIPKTEPCVKCRNKNITSYLVALKFNDDRHLPTAILVITQMFPEGALFCLLPSCDRNLEDIGYHYCKSNGNDDDQRGSSQAHNRTLEHKENQRTNGTSKIFKCYNCGKEGHLSNNCSSKPNQNSNTNNVNNRKNANTNNQSGNFKGKNFNKITSKSFNQGNSKNNSNYANNGNNMNNYKNNNSNNEVGIKCFKCGSEGHYANKCPNQNLNTPNNYGQITFQNSNNNVVGFENPAVKCYKCGQAGHYASTCTSNNSNANNQNINRKDFSQNNLNNYNNNKNINDKTVLKCFKCNQPGHFAPNCPLNIIPSNSNFPKNNNINYNNNNDNNVSKRNYNQSKIFKEKKSCEICGVKRHNKNSNCPGMKKNKKNKLTFKNENDQNSSSDDE